MSDLNNKSNIYLLITQGPHKGEKFPLLKKTIIGRSDQANISLSKDNRVSRQHAVIIFANKNFYIKNLSKSNKLFVNKKNVKECKISITDKITIGTSKLQIHVEKKSNLNVNFKASSYDQKQPKSKPRKKINPIRFLIILALIAGVYMYLNEGQESENTEREIASENNEIIEPKNTSIENKLFKVNKKKKVNVLAQSEYIKGFRDFKKGQYSRSIIHLTDCLNFQPNHTLCIRYLSLAQKKVDEIIQYQSITGRKFLDQKQYKACSSSFRNIAFLVQNSEDPRYKEARKNEKFCKQMLEESF